jgi:hypothetical protein
MLDPAEITAQQTSIVNNSFFVRYIKLLMRFFAASKEINTSIVPKPCSPESFES